MPASYETLPIRCWLQASHTQPAGCTIRLTKDPAGAPTTHDWVVTVGTRWASLDALIGAWNTALAGAATVSRDTNSSSHRSRIKVVTSGAVAYQVTWSHAGDGTCIRDRLGETGNVGTTASGTVWSVNTRGDFVSWVGVSGLERRVRTHAAARLMASGVVETQATGDADDIVTTTARLRWGIPAGDVQYWRGYVAFEQFLTDLWGQTWTGDDIWLLATAADGDSTVRTYVRWASSRLDLWPEQVAESVPYQLVELGLELEVVG